MKNLLIIDGAINCAYDIFEVADEDFITLFGELGQNIEFIEDLSRRSDWKTLSQILQRMWEAPVKKSLAQGIHGLLFYGLPDKKKYYPNKRDEDLDMTGRSFASTDL